MTNNLHHLAWRSFEFDGSILPRLGPGGWILLSYAYGLVIANLVILAWLFPRSQYHRWPVVVMLMGQFGGRGIYLLEKFYIIHSDLPLNTLGMGFEFLMYVIALFGFRIFDPIPMARQTVITQMRDGMLALDAQGRVVSLNPAAELFFGATAKQIMGKPARELLPAYPDGYLTDLSGTEIEFSRKTGQELRHYTLAVSPLRDWRELEIGRLLLLRDVTEQKQAQARILEQQRALATLQEREHLARELHDTLAHSLSGLTIQLEAVEALWEVNPCEAHQILDQARRAAQSGLTEMRRSLQALRASPLEDLGLGLALRELAKSVAARASLRLYLDVQIHLQNLAPEVEQCIYRVAQESLTNVARHADAKSLRVALRFESGTLTLTIADDGRGFDPAAVNVVSYGLQGLRERAEMVGAVLHVTSSIPGGTLIRLVVPSMEAGT